MTEKTEPKNCPFCGSKAVILPAHYSETVVTIRCDKAGCIGRRMTPFYLTREEAIDAWNKRANDETKQL